MFHRFAKPLLLLSLGMVALFMSVPIPRVVHGASGPPIVGVFSNFYFSSNITDNTLGVGSTFHVQINVTNAPPFNGFEFALYFDQNFIHLSSYVYDSRNIQCPTCVFDNSYLSPNSYNNTGALRLAVVNLATVPPAPPNNHGLFTGGAGTLADLVFTVDKVGVSPLTLAAGTASPSDSSQAPAGLCPSGCPTGSPNWTRLVDGYDFNPATGKTGFQYGVQTMDGYFKNVQGKSGPIASFTVTPKILYQGGSVRFNATSSFDPGNNQTQNKGILNYFWDFGDSSGDSDKTVSVPAYDHVFSNGGNVFVGNFSIRLTVTDRDDNFQGMLVVLVTVLPQPNHCVAVEGIQTNVFQVKPGTDVPFTVEVQNTGTFQENFTLTIIYGPPNSTLATLQNLSIQVNHIQHYNSTLPTSHLPPGIYSIYASIQLQNAANCREGSTTSQLGIKPPDTTGLLLQIVGGIAGVSALGVAIGIFRRRRGLRVEPL